MLLTRDAILAAGDIETVTVKCPEWHGDVLVRGLTARDRDWLEVNVTAGNGKQNLVNLRARTVALCVVDADGKRLFKDEDIEALGERAAKVIDRIFAAAVKLSAITPEDVKAIAKN